MPMAASCCEICRSPDFRDYAEAVPVPGSQGIGDTRVLGPFLRDIALRASASGIGRATIRGLLLML